MSKILIVDDERSIRITLSEFLKKAGFTVFSAADANEALEILLSNDIDVVVTDIIMPKVSGIELISRIRTHSEIIQILIMTGEPTVDTAVKAVREGANDYLSKPVARDVLIKAVINAANIKKLEDEKILLQEQNMRYQKDLEDRVEQSTESLREAMQSIINLLSSVVEIRDPYTAGHQRRVGNLSAKIAEKLSLPKEECELIRITGYIHDIGKIVIPAEILCKPGKLSDLEISMIRMHSLRGFEMLDKVRLPSCVSKAVLQHHEKQNGSGYPNGLTAGETSLEACILTVADVVEAMKSHRPYRPSLGLDAALEEIIENSGPLYDPEIVNACISLFKEDGYVLEDREHDIFFPL